VGKRRLREWKARGTVTPGLVGAERAKAQLRAINLDRKNDPEPSYRDAVEHIGRAQRETARQIKARRYQATLHDSMTPCPERQG
jgi:hypothetical protein